MGICREVHLAGTYRALQLGDPVAAVAQGVDDDAEIRHVLRLMCELEGFEVVGEASNGVEAVPAALRAQPSVVILDYLMPRQNGDVTARLLRSLVPDIKIVAFSAVLEEKPDWSDSYLNKERVSEVAPLLERLI